MLTASPSTRPVDFRYSLPGGKGSGIMVIEDAISAESAELLYLFAMDASEEIGAPGKTMGGVMPTAKNSIDIALPRRNEWTGQWSPAALREIGYDLDAIDAEIAMAINSALEAYKSEFPSLSGIASFGDTGYQIQRYKKGAGFYRNHVDGDPENQPHRIFACVLYLNTVEEGGETQFPHHGVSVKPVAGRMVIFPSIWLYPHEGRVPISEDKVIATTFVYSSKYLPPIN